MKKFERALITGASSGIGECFARKLAQEGTHLIIAARRRERLEALAQEIKEKYQVSVAVFPIDLTDQDAPARLLKFAEETGEVDLLINNAGIGPYRSFLKSSREDHQKVMDLNMLSLTNLCYLFSGHILKHKKPSTILNVASVASYMPVPKFAVYSASKSYVRIFSQILGFEYHGSNIFVSCLCPGGTRTEFLERNNQKAVGLGDRALMSPDKVVDVALAGIKKRKSVIIPGIFNQLTCLVASCLPFTILIRLSEGAMKTSVTESN